MTSDPAGIFAGNAVAEAVRRALAEDVGTGDITTQSIVGEHELGCGILEAHAECVIAGIHAVSEVFRQIGGCEVSTELSDGDEMKPGDRVLLVSGSLRSILTGERVALNFLQRLSGVATLTKRFVARAPGIQLRDTRKTTPGLRVLEKGAVAAGGGTNHRFGLFDAVLIKDNHIAIAGSVSEAVRRARAAGHAPIQVECDTLNQVHDALQAGAEAILLDNMSAEQISEAVRVIDRAAFVEASGGVTLETVSGLAKTGVDAISVGAITHSAPAIDLSLDVQVI